ncbi:MAG: hypothetical protein AB4426_04955 [Xenococcaceae cyanobacterium]
MQSKVLENARLDPKPESAPQQTSQRSAAPRQKLLDKNAPIQRTKKTEKRIIEQSREAGDLTAEQSQQLIDKMRKGQSFSKARKIAAEIEAETAELVEVLSPEQKKTVEEAIQNYVQSSKAIQDSARKAGAPGELIENVRQLDETIRIIREQIAENKKTRITYRSITYDDVNNIPYGRDVDGKKINVGDTVSDRGFLSTSEHRQFILGKTQKGEVPALLKLAIIGQSGVSIALHFPPPHTSYSNENERIKWEMDKNRLEKIWKSTFGQGSHGGQAEVLYGRNSLFIVKHIERKGTEVEVVLLESIQGNRAGNVIVKNMKDGKILSDDNTPEV